MIKLYTKTTKMSSKILKNIRKFVFFWEEWKWLQFVLTAYWKEKKIVEEVMEMVVIQPKKKWEVEKLVVRNE